MNKFAAVFVPAVVAVCAVATAATPHKDYDTLFKAANITGKPILIMYWQPTEDVYARVARQYILYRSQHIIYANFEVAEIHITLNDERFRRYARKVAGGLVPIWVVLTPEGDFIDGGDGGTVGFKEDQMWQTRMRKIAAKHPPLPQRVREEAAQALARAALAHEVGQYKEAHSLATAVAERVWFPRQLNAAAKALVAKVDQTGQAMLQSAAALAEKAKLLDAAKQYELIKFAFTVEHPAGEEAVRKQAALLRQDAGVSREFAVLKRQVWAGHLLAVGRALEKKSQNRDAITAYRQAGQYGGTPQAAEALEALRTLEARQAGRPLTTGPTGTAASTTRPAPPPDEGPSAAEKAEKAEKTAAALVSMAKAFHGVGQRDAARNKLLEVLLKYPKTRAALAATRLMGEWGMKLPDQPE